MEQLMALAGKDQENNAKGIFLAGQSCYSALGRWNVA
jgi:hypothetical protein